MVSVLFEIGATANFNNLNLLEATAANQRIEQLRGIGKAKFPEKQDQYER